MLYTIRNSFMTVTVDSMGAELMSITGADGTEYLWNGDKKYWKGRSPVLFPYVGRLTDNTYTLHGKPYHMTIHGFAAHCDFTAVVEEENRIILALRDSEETRKIYPYAFDFSVTYELEGDTLHTVYAVENRTRAAMYFGLGGHPGFRLPLEAGKKFEDYSLVFANPCRPNRVLMSENYMNSGCTAPFPLIDGTTLPLRHDLFDDDAIIFDHMDKTVTISAGEGSRGVTMRLPGMRYLGMWHAVRTDAPYVCLEPWCSLPSRDGVVEEFSQQGDLIRLESGEVYTNGWSVTLF